MKNNRFILFLIFTMAIIMPKSADALTQEEMYANLDKLPFTTIDGKKYLETKIVDPDVLLENGECTFTEEDYEENYIPENYPEEYTLEEWLEMRQNDCIQEFYPNVITTYLTAIGYSVEDYNYYITVDNENPNKNNVKFFHLYDESVSYDVTVSYLENPEQKEIKKASQTAKKLEDEYSLFGLTIMNSIYHYGVLGKSAYTNDTIFRRFSEFKNVIETTKGYRFVPNIVAAGGAPYYSRHYIQVGIFKDDVMYATKKVTLKEYTIMYVDKDEEGTIFERAERRINEYFNNTAEVVVDGSQSWTNSGEEFDSIVNENLKTKDKTYEGHVAFVKLGNAEAVTVIVEVPKENLDKVTISSTDLESGVNVKTESYDVPIDAQVKAKDVKDKKQIKDAFRKENLVVDAAYDISLTKSLDGKLVNKIERGIEVYLPVSEKYKVGEKTKVYYISDTDNKKETYQGEVVTINNNNYVKFVTNHFSTYALASNAIENPETLDNITNNILTAVLSLIILCSITIYIIKTRRTRAY